MSPVQEPEQEVILVEDDTESDSVSVIILDEEMEAESDSDFNSGLEYSLSSSEAMDEDSDDEEDEIDLFDHIEEPHEHVGLEARKPDLTSSSGPKIHHQQQWESTYGVH